MADFIYKRDGSEHVHVVLRVPARVWDRWESQHPHFGKAIHALRETVLEVMAIRTARASLRDGGDPFWKP